MAKKITNKQQSEGVHEWAIELRDCKAGEVIRLAYGQPAKGSLYNPEGYKNHVDGTLPYDMYISGKAIDPLHEEFCVPTTGTWYLVVKAADDGQLLTSPIVERLPYDPIPWNETHVDTKIVRKQPTPYDAPMASTLGYWERNTGNDFSKIESCPLCWTALEREDARCALVTIPGEMPVKHYVVPLCSNCYENGNGKTFFVGLGYLCKAPKA